MTFEEFTAENGDASFRIQLGDNILGSLAAGDPQDIHTAKLYTGHTYSFTLTYAVFTDPITLEVRGPTDVFTLAAPTFPGTQTFTLTFVASENATYSFDLGATTSITMGYNFAFTVDITPQGTELRDLITGSLGDDSVDLGGGDDYMRALTGNDTIFGGTGEDRILAGDGDDSVDGGDQNDYIIAGRGDDSIFGGSGKDKIEAGDGNDTVAGGSGNDVIAAGNGQDMIYGGTKNDRISGGNGHDTINAGTGNDRLWGGNGNDLLIAGDGRDQIRGGSGRDTIYSGGGDDDIRGGASADLFVFERGMDEDTIWDFEDNRDLLDFSAFGFTQMSDLNIFQSDTNTVIAYNHDWFLTLRNFDVSLIDDGDFVWASLL